jgi:2-haloacid dehalogenase
VSDSGKIEVCVFDAYGTLFDVHSAVARHRPEMGEKADGVSQTWRTKQLEYTWLRSLMGRYVGFASVTADALDYAMQSHDMINPALREKLLQAYLTLDCYPEVPGVLETLATDGLRLAVLSNGSPEMLDAATRSSGLAGALEAVLSVDELKIYKPHPRVYQMACDRLGVEANRVMFLSSNGWDATGAKSFGFNVTWVNRFGQKPEKLGFAPDRTIDDLDNLPGILKQG